MNRLRVTSRTSPPHKVIRAGVAAGAIAFAAAASAPAPREGPLPGAAASDTTHFFRYPSGATADTSLAFRNPTGIAVDATGRVYVASGGDSSVAVFAPGASGSTVPILRIGPESGLVSPQALSLGNSGLLYVSSGEHRGAGKGSITVYPPTADGNVAPMQVIAGPRTGFSEPIALALGMDGRLYVVNGATSKQNVFIMNGMRADAGLDVLVFDARAEGDAAPVQRLVEISDTAIPSRSDPRSEAPLRTEDTTCGKPVSTTGSVVCQTGPHIEPKKEPIRTPPQRPDTAKPLDVALGARGELLVLTSRGVTRYDRAGARHRTLSLRLSDRFSFSESMLNRPRMARSPSGELYIAGKTPGGGPDQMLTMFPGKPARGNSAQTPSPAPGKAGAQDMKKRFESLIRSMTGEAFISVFAAGDSTATTAVRTITGTHTGLGSVADLAVAADGSLYALASSGSGGRRIAVFPPNADGDIPPARVIEGPRTGLRGSTSLTLDGQGRIYVANDRTDDDRVFGAATVTVYAADASGDAVPIRTVSGSSTRLRRPSGIAVGDDGTIYVVNLDIYDDDHGSVRVFGRGAAGRDSARRTLIGRDTRFATPQGIAVDGADTLYVVSGQLARITVYPPEAGGSAAPVRTIEGPATELRGSRFFPYDPGLPSQLAIDAAGYLYLADPAQASGLNAYGPDLGAVRVYRPGAGGNEAPVRRIIGGYTKLNGPGGVAIDRRGNLYVPNRYGTGPGSITIYGPDADGDVHPIRMIAGPATALQAPAAVALDAHDTLYVVNAASVTVYAPRANGNASPVRTIEAQ